MYWDDAAGAFKVSGTIRCEDGPCQTSTFDTERTVQAMFFSNMGGARGWSQALGGELFIPLAGVTGSVQSASVNVVPGRN
jgi:hypothetical protein